MGLAAAGLAWFRATHPATCATRPPAGALVLHVDGATVNQTDQPAESCELVTDLTSTTATGAALQVAVRAELQRSGWQLRDDEALRSAGNDRFLARLDQVGPDRIVIHTRTTSALPTIEWSGLRLPRAMAGRVLAVTSSGVVAFDPASRQVLWSRGCLAADWLSPYQSPEVDVAVVLCAGQYVALDPATGTQLWTHPPLADVSRSRTAGASLLVCTKTFIQVIDIRTGDNRWREDQRECAATAGNGVVYVDDANRGVRAYDERTGDLKLVTGDPTYAVFALDDAVLSRTAAHAVQRLDGRDGTQSWKSPTEATRLNSSNFRGATDHAVVLESRQSGTQYTAYDRATGTRLWTLDDPGKDDSSAGGDIFAIARDARGEPSGRSIVVVDDRSGARRASFDDASVPGVTTMGSDVVYFAGTAEAPELVVRRVP